MGAFLALQLVHIMLGFGKEAEHQFFACNFVERHFPFKVDLKDTIKFILDSKTSDVQFVRRLLPGKSFRRSYVVHMGAFLSLQLVHIMLGFGKEAEHQFFACNFVERHFPFKVDLNRCLMLD